jgi:hypothetical protein
VSNPNFRTLREIVYDVLDDGHHNGEFSLDGDRDLIAAGLKDRLEERIEYPVPDNWFDLDELADMVDDWFDSRRIGVTL